MLPAVTLLLLLLLGAADGFLIFDGFAGANLTLTRGAAVSGDGLLLLTNLSKEAQGHAFYPVPFSFKNGSTEPRSFSAVFVAAIVAEYPTVSGHGITFALAPSPELLWTMPSRNLGLFNSTGSGDRRSQIVAVELDTAQDAEVKDINDNHVGIDVDSLISVNSSAPPGIRLVGGGPVQVWVEYAGRSMRLDVAIAPAGNPKPAAALVSATVNLSAVLADDTFVGFTAANGAATSTHYILGWSFAFDGEVAPDLDLAKLPRIPQPKTPPPPALAPVAAMAAVLAAAAFAAGALCIVKRRKDFAEVEEEWEKQYGPQRISYRELHRATRGFSDEKVIGVGGFGKVYGGVLPRTGTPVAVKKIGHDSKQGMREFVAEIASMSRLRHRSLVQLLGYCRRRGELILVYEYMANGSLDKFLFGKAKEPLSWRRRFKIINDVAAGLLYLHEGWEQLVVHRDIKASNVLLDSDMNGKLGDFGLARLYDHGSNAQTTHIVGTVGYLAPELSKTGKATTCTDVYAFGAFLLEVACGRRPIDAGGDDDEPGLVDFVLECWNKGRIVEARDPRMDEEEEGFDGEEVEMVLKLGLLCSHPDPNGRPSMREVVRFLERSARLPREAPEGLGGSARMANYAGFSFDEFAMSTTTEGFTVVATTSSVSSGDACLH